MRNSKDIFGVFVFKRGKKYNDIYKGGYYDKMSNVVCDAMKTFNEVTTQYLAEILTAYSYGKKKKDASVFDSKIMIKNDYFKSYFVTYPEYEQLFISFLRTLNGFGNIEDNDKLFYKWFEELKSGHIWDRIIGTYNNEQSKELLLEFLVGYNAVRKEKESSMGIGVDYTGDKNILTKNLIELDTALAKNINYNKEVKYPHENIPKPPSEYPIHIKLGKKK